MKGEGFSGDPYMGANRAYMGDKECEVMEEFTTENQIVCKDIPGPADYASDATPRGSSFAPSGQSVRVNVNVDGRWMTRTTNIEYSPEVTAQYEAISHTSVHGGIFYFRGPLISRYPAQYNIGIGSDKVRCSVLEQIEAGNIEAFAEEPNGERHFACSPSENEAGYHNVTLAVEADLMSQSVITGAEDESITAEKVGNTLPSPQHLPDLFKMNATNQIYQVVHHPSITSITPLEASTRGGTILRIEGEGFSEEIDENSVVVGNGVECVVKSASPGLLKCEVPAMPSSSTAGCSCCPCACCKPGAAGLLHEYYPFYPAGGDGDGDGDGDADGDAGDGGDGGDGDGPAPPHADLTAKIDNAITTQSPLRTSVWADDLHASDILRFGSHFQKSGVVTSGAVTRTAEKAKIHNEINVLSGFFIPPYSGEYTFYVSGNDIARLYLAADTASPVLAAEAYDSVNIRSGRFHDTSSPQSFKTKKFSLSEGTPVYLELRHADHTGDNFFSVGVSHPSDIVSCQNCSLDGYQTLPTMFSTNASSISVDGTTIQIGNNADCTTAVGALIEKRLKSRHSEVHVISNGKMMVNETRCRYFVHIFRPKGAIAVTTSKVEELRVLVEGDANEWFYDPLPLAFLRLPEKTNSEVIGVEVRNVPAVYNSTAAPLAVQYSDSLVSSVSSISATVTYNGWLDIAISSPSSFTPIFANLDVSIGGKQCLSPSQDDDGSGLQFDSQNNVLRCRVPDLDAGNHPVAVHLGKYGVPSGGPFSTKFALQIGSVTSNVGGAYGGAELVIVGQGFSAVTTQNVVTIGGADCAVLTATSQKLTCLTPEGTGQNVQLLVMAFGETASSTYTYDGSSPYVDAFALAGGGTGLPSGGGATLLIDGSNFPSSETLRVVLFDTTAPAALKFCEVLINKTNDRHIECTTPSLQAGGYELRVQDPAKGWSQSGLVLESSFAVTDFSPTVGSNWGGALLTFSGRGFTAETFVMVGPISEVGLECVTRNVSDVELTCQIERNTRQLLGFLTVRVYANKRESFADGIHASCPLAQNQSAIPKTFNDSCVYQMTQEHRATVTSFTQNTHGHDSEVVIRGDNLNNVFEVRAGNTFCEVFESSTTTVKCNMGVGHAGSYRLFVSDEYGFATLPSGDKQWYRFATAINSISPAEGSRAGGTVVTISGAGFHTASETTVQVGDGNCTVLSVTLTTLTCVTSPGGVGKSTITITTDGVVGSKPGLFSVTIAATPSVSRVSPARLATAGTITISGSRLLQGNEGAVTVLLGGVPCTTGSITDKEIICSVSAAPALDIAPLVVTASGHSLPSKSATVAIDLSFSVQHSPQSSYFGGKIVTLVGSGFGTRAEVVVVQVCGFESTLHTVDDTRLLFYTPALVTKEVVDANPTSFPIQTLSVVGHHTSNHYRKEAQKLLDGDYKTEGMFQWNGAAYFDVGETFVMYLRSLEFFPSDTKYALRPTQVGVLIEIGDFTSGFQLLHNVTYVPKTGWNKVVFNTSIPLGRYLKISHPTYRAGMTEIKLKGYKVTDSVVNATCPVTVSVTATNPFPAPNSTVVSSTQTYAVEYVPTFPKVTAFAPEYGTAAGGTEVVISGQNFDGTANEAIEVVVDGITCVVLRSSASEIVCITGARPEIPNPTLIGISVRIPGRGYANIVADPFIYADKWSSSLTWANGAVPREGDSVSLVKGRNVILDISPPRLVFMIIDGALIFEDTQDIEMTLQYILVRGGRLQIGKKNAPFTHKATITLYGNRTAIPLPVYGSKNIAVRGGAVLMYGQPKLPTWTRLAATVNTGDTSITLRDVVNWVVGDEIVIAPGSFDYLEGETREIARIDGNTLFFDKPLRYHHFGEIEDHHGIAVDMSVEVGVLSRNIVIQGDVDSWKQKFGAHMIFHSPDRHVKAHLEYLEMRRVGQAKIIGRYPIHFHKEQERSEDVYVKGCSIHHSWNRAIVLHSTSFVTVEQNVAFNTLGHMYFVEDGNEKYNTFKYNLGIGAKPTGGQLAHDVFTSVYWMANPQNNFIGNAAAGSSHMGFWLSPPKHPRRGSFTERECPADLPLGYVHSNTAHSNGRHGFWVHPKHYAREQECGPDSEADNKYAVSTVSNLRTWKNVEQGLGLVDTGPYVLENILSIDCSDAGVEVGDITGEQGAIVRHSVFIAESHNNRVNEWRMYRAVTGKRGLITPKSEGLRAHDLTFIGFTSKRDGAGEWTNQAGVYTCCRCWNDCSSEMGAFTSRFWNIVWHNNPNRVMFGWPHNDILIDEDGSFAGGAANATLLPTLDHTRMPECAVGPSAHQGPTGFGMWTGRRNVPGMICPPKYAFHKVVIHKPTPEKYLIFTFDIESSLGHTQIIYDDSKNRGWSEGWAMPVATTSDSTQVVPYKIYYGENLDWEELQVWVQEIVEHPFKSMLQLDFNYTDNYALFDVLARQMGGKRGWELLDLPSPPISLPMSFRNHANASVTDGTTTGSFSNLDQQGKVLSLVFTEGDSPGMLSLPSRARLVQMESIPCVTLKGSDQCIKMQEEIVPNDAWYESFLLLPPLQKIEGF